MKTRTSALFFLHLIFLWCFSNPLWAIELKEHSASYTANIKKGVSIKGTAIRSLSRIDNEHWLYRFDVDSFVADIKESARLRITQAAEPDKTNLPAESDKSNQLIIKPINYDYTLSAFLMPDRKRQVQFDWNNKSATSPIKKDKWTLNNIPENTYDALSYQLQLLIDVSAGKKEMTYQLANKAKLRESTFVVLGAEVINTRFGKLNSILAKKQRDDDAKRQTFLWFSADYPLLLLKMTQRESDGEEYEIQLKEATIEGKSVDFSGHVVN